MMNLDGAGTSQSPSPDGKQQQWVSPFTKGLIMKQQEIVGGIAQVLSPKINSVQVNHINKTPMEITPDMMVVSVKTGV